MKTMAAGKFKAQCLAVLDEVKMKREEVVVTKNGKPYAKMVPLDEDDGDPLAVFRFGRGRIVGDIVSPAASLEDWESER